MRGTPSQLMRYTSVPLPLLINGSLIEPILTLDDILELESSERELLSLKIECFLLNSGSFDKDESLILCCNCF